MRRRVSANMKSIPDCQVMSPALLAWSIDPHSSSLNHCFSASLSNPRRQRSAALSQCLLQTTLRIRTMPKPHTILSLSNETILRQVCIGGVWRPEHSPIIEHTTEGHATLPVQFRTMFLSENVCLWYICLQARTVVENEIPANAANIALASSLQSPQRSASLLSGTLCLCGGGNGDITNGAERPCLSIFFVASNPSGTNYAMTLQDG